jgi:hypothetical protein
MTRTEINYNGVLFSWVLKEKMLEAFGKHQIKKIEDITHFVKQQKQLLDADRLDALLVPFETAFKTGDAALNDSVGIER